MIAWSRLSRARCPYLTVEDALELYAAIIDGTTAKAGAALRARSFKGRLVQYTGRLMRAEEGKTTVRVYDYADRRVPVLRAMHTRRLTTYKLLGFAREKPVASSQLPVPILGP